MAASDNPATGLMSMGNPNPTGGGGGLLGIDPDLLFSLGTGLMSAAKYQGNLGDSLQQAMGGYYNRKLAKQQLGMGGLQMQQLQQEMPMRMNYLKTLGEALDVGNNSPAITQALNGGGGGGLMGSPPSQGQQPQGGLLGAPVGAPTQGATPMPAPMPTAQAAPQGGAPQAQMPPQQGAPPQQAPQMPPQRQPVSAYDPMRLMQIGAFGSALGIQGSQGVQEFGKTLLANDPQQATRMEAAKSAVTVDQQMIQDAATRGDYQTAAMLQQKLAKDSSALDVSRNSRQWFDTKDGQWHSLDTSTGMQIVGDRASLVSGAADATQQLAASRSLGQAQGELVDVVDPVTHQTYRVPKSTLLPGGAGASRSAPMPNASGSAPSAGGTPGARASGPAIAALSPGQAGFLAERGTESAKYITQLQDAADSATNTNYALDQMIASGARVKLGPNAGVREWMESAAAGLGQPFGIDPPKELASYQELDKYANQIAFAATRQMGSREAAQIVSLQMKSNPNKELVPESFTGLAQSMKAMNNYMIAKNSAIQAQSGADNDTALQAASAWTSRIDPRVWALSLSPDLATKFASSIGPAKIATALPAMAHDDGISVIRNIPESMRPVVLSRLPLSVKQEILAGMQQSGATGHY